LSVATTETPEPQEYCETEAFEASCAETETVVITSAHYGRMHIGRCIRMDLGFVGCSADVLSYVSSECDGQSQCQVRVSAVGLDELNPCPRDLTAYLEVAYECLASHTGNSRHDCEDAWLF
jgi:hypothetical protein